MKVHVTGNRTNGEEGSTLDAFYLMKLMDKRRKKHLEFVMSQIVASNHYLLSLKTEEQEDKEILKKLNAGENINTQQNLKKQATKLATTSEKKKKSSTVNQKKRKNQSCSPVARKKKPAKSPAVSKAKKAKASTPSETTTPQATFKPTSSSQGRGGPMRKSTSDGVDVEVKKMKPLTKTQISTLNEQVNELDDEGMDRVLEIASQYICDDPTGEGSEIHLDVESLPASFQWQIKEMVESRWQQRVYDMSSPSSDPEETEGKPNDKNKQEEDHGTEEVSTITFHASSSPSAVSQDESQAEFPPPVPPSQEESSPPVPPSPEDSPPPSSQESSSQEEVVGGAQENYAVVPPVMYGDTQPFDIDNELDYGGDSEDDGLDMY